MTLEVVVPSVGVLQDPVVPVFPSDIQDGALVAYSNMAQDHAVPFHLDQEAVDVQNVMVAVGALNAEDVVVLNEMEAVAVQNVKDRVVPDTVVEVVQFEVVPLREREPFPVAESMTNMAVSSLRSRDAHCHRTKVQAVHCSDDCD